MSDDYARGGYVPGNPVPVLRHHDDFFFTAEQVRQLGTAMLDQLNTDRDAEEEDVR